MTRKRKKRKLKKCIYIVCEGKNTEPIYLGGIKEQVEERNTNYVYDIILHDTKHNDPIGLVREAKKLLKEDKHAEAWAVFDKNGYTKHSNAFSMAKSGNHKVNIAFSSIAFEQWVLLHFERSNIDYKKAGNIIIHLRKAKFVPNYSKKAKLNLYSILKDKTITAFENSAWLLSSMSNQINEKHGKIYNINPYTDVDKLVKKLLNYNEEIKWQSINNVIDFKNFFCQVIKLQKEKNKIYLTVEINNKLDYQLMLNSNMLKIYLKSDIYKIYHNSSYSNIIMKNDKFVVDLCFNINETKKELLLNVSYNNQRNIMEVMNDLPKTNNTK